MGDQNGIGGDDEPTQDVRYEPESSIGLTELLVTTVADVRDADPLALDPLYETFDPDALIDFVETGNSGDLQGRISFRYEDCDVTVHANGLIEIRPSE